jgi:HK97 gp10 family phage protein
MPARPDLQITIDVEGAELTKWKIIRQGERTQKRLAEIIDVFAFKIQREAQLRAPVDTGFLRSSIHVDEIEEFYNEVVASADYAHFVEFGTRRTPAQPFMQPAVETLAAEFREEVQKALRWGWLS